MQEENELDTRLLGSSNILNPFIGNNSASRSNMDAAHISQMLVLPHGDPMRISAGVDFEYMKYTFKIEVEEDCIVLRVFNKYPKGGGIMNFRKNPETIIITESMDGQKRINVIELTHYHCNHKFAGFQYVFTDVAKNIKRGDYLIKGTVLAHSPSLKEGNYCYGLEANIAAGSFPWVIEDGIAVSESFCRRAQSVGFGSRTAEWGKDYYPLNLYGDENNYKPFPDIGERVREDGLVFALRKVTPYLAAAEMTPKALMEPDYTFDTLVYGQPNAIVEDIDVWHNHAADAHKTPSGMDMQARKYWNATQEYGRKLTDFYRETVKNTSGNFAMTPELHAMIVRAKLNQEENLNGDSVRTFCKEKLDDWRVEVSYSYPVIPTLAHKLSDISAGKGVITKVVPDEDMPVDKHGTRADILVDDGASVHRMIAGRNFYQCYTAVMDQILRDFETKFDKDDVEGKFDYYMSFVEVASPKMRELFGDISRFNKVEKQHILEKAIREKLRIYLPHNTPLLGSVRVKMLQDKFPVDIGPVTFRGINGKMVTTKENCLISSAYFIMIEKIGDDWGGTAVPKRQHHGVVAKLSNNDKYSENYRNQSIRNFGETEYRIVSSVVNPTMAAALINFPNSPAMCMDAVKTILSAPVPSDIRRLMDYEKHLVVESRPLQFVKHILRCYGFKFDYVDEEKYTDAKIINGVPYFVDERTGELLEIRL